MKRQRYWAIAAITALASGMASARADIIFNDSFSTSTLNAAAPAAPTSTSTDYAVLSTRNATASSIAPGLLKVTNIPTSSGFTEVQARFYAAPLTLAVDGDYVELSTTFSPLGVLYASGSSIFGVGLYNSHGISPVPGGAMNNGLLNSTDATYATGYAAGWEGFASRNFPAGGSAQLITRPAQTDIVNESQDLLFNNAGTGAFDNPLGAILAPPAVSTVMFTNGSIYTCTFRLTLAAGGVIDVSDKIYEGVGTSGTILLSHAAQTTGVQTIATQFDAFAIGFRAMNDVTNPVPEHVLNISRIQVTSNVPEPASLIVGATCGLALVVAGRRRTVW